jgi:hypothetical protein
MYGNKSDDDGKRGGLLEYPPTSLLIVGAVRDSANAAPSAEPICRPVVLSAEPIANFPGGKNAVALLDRTDKLQPTPEPQMIISGK